jgi:hypothetical protein
MTRVLSELLGHSGPGFHLNLQQLERGAGLPSHDVRLTAEVLQSTQRKLRELGLDPHDTAGHELYAVMGARLREDERRFAAALQAGSPDSDDPIAHVARVLEKEFASAETYALKNTVAKRLLKSNLPKKTMKALGYRSADSMLKHESVASLYAAAMLIETDQWLKKQLASYTKLKGSDFESRKLNIEHPVSRRWQELAETVVATRRHNIVAFKELGAVVLLPLPAQRPELITLTTAVLTVHAANDIFAASTFLRLHQVQPKFGDIVREVAADEPVLSVSLLDQPVSWSVVQRFYARVMNTVHSDVFEPVLHVEDFVWHSVEQVISRIEPTLHFWLGTSHLALLHQGSPVSCNLTDMVVSHCNGLPFERVSSQYFRHELGQELSLRYLNQGRLEQAIANKFQHQIAAPAAI